MQKGPPLRDRSDCRDERPMSGPTKMGGVGGARVSVRRNTGKRKLACSALEGDEAMSFARGQASTDPQTKKGPHPGWRRGAAPVR